ncbi:hypothetical protein F5X99DRAFT_415849 [Biscogniauxia marginata]|nr:hypothetical protein F5X99DRAFT_415849 [Biscogniauxia marginata]
MRGLMYFYYHYEIIHTREEADNARHNVRGGMDVMEATNYRPGRPIFLPSTIVVIDLGKGRSSSAAGPIYEASSLGALLAVLNGCISGYKSLREAGMFYRDISVNNLLINETLENLSWLLFLIDLDFASREQREGALSAKRRTGTRAFRTIIAPLGEQYSFILDLEFLGVFRSKRPLMPWVDELRQVVFSNGGRWKKEDRGSYVRVKGILQAAQKDPKVIMAGR